MRVLYDEPRRGTADSRINFIHPKDAGGVLVELVQPAVRPPAWRIGHGTRVSRVRGLDSQHC